MASTYESVWAGLSPELRTHLAENRERDIGVEATRSLPMVDGSALSSLEGYGPLNGPMSEAWMLDDGFAEWIEGQTTEGRFAHGWDVLTLEERHVVADSKGGEIPDGLVPRLSQMILVAAATWTSIRKNPDHWDVSQEFVEYVRERLARGAR